MKVVPIARKTADKRVAPQKTTKDYGDFIAAISQLTEDQSIQVEPDSGDSIRKLKLNFSRAVKLLPNTKIKYGENKEGNALIVWLDTDPPKEKRTRRRHSSAEDVTANEGMESAAG